MPKMYLVTSPQGRTRLNYKIIERVGGGNPGPNPNPNPNPEDWQPAYPGQPAPGTVLWGAGISGTGDPWPKHEQPTGKRIGVRRTFQTSWSQARINSMVSLATGDLAVGRVPWVSIKPPSWAEMAAGNHDTLIDDMLTKLGALNGPVWLTIHHEPEGGSGINAPDDPAGPEGHVAMNRRVRQRMTALGVTNIALAPILMAYTWLPTAWHRNPDLWWDSDIYDFMGIDHYRDSGTLQTSRWNDVRAWGYAKGVDINLGEWGQKDTPGNEAYIHEWHQMCITSHTHSGRARISGACYFDSDRGPNGDMDGYWTLVGARLAAFHERLQHEKSVNFN